jgi:hypothetical protein
MQTKYFGNRGQKLRALAENALAPTLAGHDFFMKTRELI